MDNRFELVDVRLHLYDIHKILFKGIFSRNEMGKNNISISISGKEIGYNLDIREGVGVRRMYGWYPYPIDKEYYFWCDIPKDIDSHTAIVVTEESDGNRKKIFEILLKDIFVNRKRIVYSIDNVEYVQDKIKIDGWIIGDSSINIILRDLQGNQIDSKAKYGYRRDVVEAFPEAEPEDIKGFTVLLKKPQGKKFQFILCNGQAEEQAEIPTSESKFSGYVKKIKGLSRKGVAYYKRYGVKETYTKVKDKLFHSNEIDYERWLRNHMPSKAVLDQQRIKQFEYSPKISIVVPLYKTPKKYLKEMIESVVGQTYGNWELCLSDGSGENSPIDEILREYEKSDSRIKVVRNPSQLQISENTNMALKVATGEYIAFADHDDLLTSNALFECVKIINRYHEVDAIYTDEDKVSMDGKKHFQPHFKPDYNKDLLNTTNYFCHLFVVSKDIIEKVGVLDSEYDGAQDYDFVLRCSEQTDKIYHIPKILYHWRAHEDSTAENPESKMYAFEAGARAIQSHYERIGMQNTRVSQTECLGVYRTHYKLDDSPLVSIIIPNKDHIKDLDKCLKSLGKCKYENYEIIIVENNSVEPETFSYYNQIERENSKITIVYWKGEFNYSAINNFGVEYAKGSYLLFLNNDTEIINEDCIEELLGFCMREDVGAVGARLFYEDGTIQHAGVIVGLGGIAGHVFSNTPGEQVGYFARIISQQDYSAVTAACIMVKKQTFEKVGGFDPKLKVAFNDVDLCLKIRSIGQLVVYNPYAKLYHYESKSRGNDDTAKKIKRFNQETALFEERWEKILKEGDPYYNRNFAIDKTDCSLKK